MRYRAVLAYDGAAFQGFQRQRDGVPTVQDTVERALGRITGAERVPIVGAGRTDTGVHASGQVIAFDMMWSHGAAALMRALNANLPRDIAVYTVQPTRDDFNPRFDAVRRAYAYTLVYAPHPLPLIRHRAWVVQQPVSLEKMREAAAHIPGRRDFGALGTPPQGNNTVRTVFLAEWHTEPDMYDRLVFTIEADAFLYRMVRRTVGMLYDVGRGKLSLDAFLLILNSGEVTSNVTVAPPQGLVLTRVTYPDDGERAT